VSPRETGSLGSDCSPSKRINSPLTRKRAASEAIRDRRNSEEAIPTSSRSRELSSRDGDLFRDNCALYILPAVNYCAHYKFTHTTGRRVRVRRCACVAESLTLGAHGSHNALYGHYGHCETRERMNMCTMHQRVKAQWRTTQTPELRRQSA